MAEVGRDAGGKYAGRTFSRFPSSIRRDIPSAHGTTPTSGARFSPASSPWDGHTKTRLRPDSKGDSTPT